MRKKLSVAIMVIVLFLVVVTHLSCKTDIKKVKEGARDYVSRDERDLNVRILLLSNVKKAELSVDGRYQILGSLSNVIDEGMKLDKTSVFVENGWIHLGGRRYYNSELRIRNLAGSGTVLNSVPYRGEIRILPQTDKEFSVIEEINTESFVVGVLGCEMPNSWNEDALRSQTVAIRTYVENRKNANKNESFHLDKLDLAYKGMLGETAISGKIVQDTAGIVMAYKGEIFSAYFHSTCGGHTEDVNLVFGREKLSPLAGVKCGYCENSKYYTWTVDIEKSAIIQSLQKAKINVSSIVSVNAVNTGPGNHGSEVEIIDVNGKERINANRFRLLIGPNNLYSTAFTTRNNGKSITFSGKGWGHGVGLCQYGAQGMAKKGFNWREILGYYYPKSELRRIY